MKIGIHTVKFIRNMRVVKYPGDEQGYWAVYPLPRDPMYAGGPHPEHRIWGDPMMFNELLDGLAKCSQKRTLVAYWRKTDKTNTTHIWKPALWRNTKGLCYGRINELGRREIFHTSYPRMLKRWELDIDKQEFVRRKTLVEGKTEEQLIEWYEFAVKRAESRGLQ